MEDVLISIYKKMFDIENIDVSSSDENKMTFDGSITAMSDITVFTSLHFNNNLLIYGDNYFLGNNNNYSNNITSFNCISNILNSNDLNCGNDIDIQSKVSCMNNLSILQTCNITTNIDCNDLNLNNNIYANELKTDQISIGTDLILHSNEITIGNENTVLTISGNLIALNTAETELSNKKIILNKTSNDNRCGIQLNSISSSGYILSNTNNSHFNIKLPDKDEVKYICLLDSTNNLYISGNSLFHDNVTIYDDLNIAGKSVINIIDCNNLNVVETLQISSLTATENMTINSNINVGNNYNCNSLETNNFIVGVSLTSLSNLNTTNITTQVCIFDNLTIGNDVDLLNNLLCNDCTGNNLNNTSLSTNNCTANGVCNVNNNCTVFNNLNSTNGFINNNITSMGVLNVNGDITITNNITIGSDLNLTNYIIIVPDIREYTDSNDAANNGVPLNGLYRTSNIVRIREDITKPIMTLVGNSTINISTGTNYIEPGVTSNENTLVYIVSILQNTTETLNTEILINNNLEIPSIDTSVPTTYIITYATKDSDNNINIITRTLNVV